MTVESSLNGLYPERGGSEVQLFFYDIGSYADIIQDILSPYIQCKEKNITFSTAKRAGIKLGEDEYIIFYLIANHKMPGKIKKLLKDYKIRGKVVALCKDYEDGIQAIENGNDFALQIPLIKDKVIHCYEFFIKKSIY